MATLELHIKYLNITVYFVLATLNQKYGGQQIAKLLQLITPLVLMN